ncbi:unnamed protein product [Heterobilharzia americana]|nr:unnamed protein product [Heterobilharzia americana]CAH8585443.1 unnamed protein product [Heterobilharzia americana]
MDSKDFETASGKLVQYIIEYRNGANKRKFSVLPDLEKIKPGYLQRLLPNRAPENKEQFDEILQDIRQKIIPGVTHWQHPDFHAFYPTCTSYPTMLGDLLAAAIGCVGFTWLACPACTELEVITLDWLVHALKLPEKFLSATGKRDPSHTGGGVIELSASMACATLTMGLRDRMLRNYIKDPHSLSEDDHLKGNGPGSLVDRMVAYTSDQCVATMGTTSTCEFEDLQGIGQVCNDYGIWFHVDAAYGGIALLCPELRHLSRGIELADSVNINAHKMMMVNVDSSPLWLSDHRVLTEAFEANPLYLHHAYGGMPDYRKWSLSLARGFRSLKLWFVLRTYGLSGLREMTRHKISFLSYIMDSEEFLSAAQQLIQFIVKYRNGAFCREFPVLPDQTNIKPGYLIPLMPNRAPEDKENFDQILQDIKDKIMPGVTHWQHPDFHAYYPTASSYASMLGDLFSASIACMGFSWISCPACTEMEVITLDWLVHAFGLPDKFLSACSVNDPLHKGGGVIELSASLACVTVSLGVRDRLMRSHMKNSTNPDQWNDEENASLVSRLVAYTSDQAHSSVTRAFRVALLNFHVIQTKKVGKRLVFDSIDLQEAIESDKNKGLIPAMCVATMGTTSTCEFEDLHGIGTVCKKYNIWFHVDGAYGGSALLCPEFRHLGEGIELADSVTINAHKMLLTNFDCSLLWLCDHHIISDAFEANPLYLRHTFEGMPEYRNWSLSLGRRFRALKLWFVLRLHGLKNLRGLLRLHAQLAKRFEHLLIEDGRFEIVNDIQYGLVCFRMKVSTSE